MHLKCSELKKYSELKNVMSTVRTFENMLIPKFAAAVRLRPGWLKNLESYWMYFKKQAINLPSVTLKILWNAN